MGWWQTGAKQAEQEKQSNARKNASGRRFWLKVGESRKVVFLEDIWPSDTEQSKFWPERTFSCYEHALRLNNDFQTVEFATCTKGLEKDFGPCYVCGRQWRDGSGKAQNFNRLYRNFASILDTTPWINDEGKIYACSKRVLVMKGEVFELLAGKAKKKRDQGEAQGLKNWLVDISRISTMRKSKGNGKEQEMSPKIGNDFEPLGKVTVVNGVAQLPVKLKLSDGRDHPGLVDVEGKAVDLNPFDWAVALAPRSKDELEAMFSSNIVTDDSQARPGAAGGSNIEPSGGSKAGSSTPAGGGSAAPEGGSGKSEEDVPY